MRLDVHWVSPWVCSWATTSSAPENSRAIDPSPSPYTISVPLQKALT